MSTVAITITIAFVTMLPGNIPEGTIFIAPDAQADCIVSLDESKVHCGDGGGYLFCSDTECYLKAEYTGLPGITLKQFAVEHEVSLIPFRYQVQRFVEERKPSAVVD